MTQPASESWDSSPGVRALKLWPRLFTNAFSNHISLWLTLLKWPYIWEWKEKLWINRLGQLAWTKTVQGQLGCMITLSLHLSTPSHLSDTLLARCWFLGLNWLKSYNSRKSSIFKEPTEKQFQSNKSLTVKFQVVRCLIMRTISKQLYFPGICQITPLLWDLASWVFKNYWSATYYMYWWIHR